MRCAMVLVAITLWMGASAAATEAEQRAKVELGAHDAEISSQDRRRIRRAPRITVRPVRPALSPPGYGTGADLSNWKRDCVPVFEERWIPQWGGRVLYANQRCRWMYV
ncbi:MAG TPA: hypothetical protein VHG27_09825, partial [Xanthobacteraceae bacterium]|nr:hypothetical protein [Xanthobacteraceae bacterium]